MHDWVYGLRRRLDALTGGIERDAARLAAHVDWSTWTSGRPTVLCLDRALFRKDLHEMRKWTTLNLVPIRATQVKRFQNPWVAPRWRRQTFLAHDLTDQLEHVAPFLERFGRTFLGAVQQKHPIDAVMAANTDYWQDEALKLACLKLNIPFLVLSRESYGIGRGREYVSDVYQKAKFNFIGAGCAVASDRCETYLSSCGSLDRAIVRATGWPRYDAWLDQPLKPQQERTAITLLGYADPNAVQYAAENFADAFKEFVAVARAHKTAVGTPDLRFVVKLKKQRDAAWLDQIVPGYQSSGIIVTADLPLPDLLADSRVAIGYNTLAVLEALLADTAVVVPCWGDSKRDQHRSLVHYENAQDQQVCYFPMSRQEFRALLERAVAGALQPKGTREQRLKRFSLHCKVDHNRRASNEVETFILSFLPS